MDGWINKLMDGWSVDDNLAIFDLILFLIDAAVKVSKYIFRNPRYSAIFYQKPCNLKAFKCVFVYIYIYFYVV